MIAKRTLRQFWIRHANSEAPLKAWYRGSVQAEWKSYADVRSTFKATDHVGDRLVFNVGGNSYCVVCGINYEGQTMFIKWVGTHAEYDKLDVTKL